ncbi:hypothetical protein SISSUDRAFT_1122994 [Sistotremastrum suecicum HHB10207 ss-3]|uniref:ARM repeat-containing protein n=1 Tax=Sistotremastrum suecicum HHB10207 ss-3 TaxID=1314776 RepID=A0A165YG80_9AGAM|nr:hypothetical protein SISSUDRAFT_1122994 [Sistotremastrum suecicum HHB10207 ss-3]
MPTDYSLLISQINDMSSEPDAPRRPISREQRAPVRQTMSEAVESWEWEVFLVAWDALNNAVRPPVALSICWPSMELLVHQLRDSQIDDEYRERVKKAVRDFTENAIKHLWKDGRGSGEATMGEQYRLIARCIYVCEEEGTELFRKSLIPRMCSFQEIGKKKAIPAMLDAVASEWLTPALEFSQAEADRIQQQIIEGIDELVKASTFRSPITGLNVSLLKNITFASNLILACRRHRCKDIGSLILSKIRDEPEIDVRTNALTWLVPFAEAVGTDDDNFWFEPLLDFWIERMADFIAKLGPIQEVLGAGTDFGDGSIESRKEICFRLEAAGVPLEHLKGAKHWLYRRAGVLFLVQAVPSDPLRRELLGDFWPLFAPYLAVGDAIARAP